MNKTFIAFAAAVMIVATPAFAGPTQTANVSATVGETLDLSMAILKIDTVSGNPTGSNLGTSIPFGELVSVPEFGVMRGADPYAVFLGTNSSSRPYTVKATMPALASGSNTLPHAMVMTFVSAKANNADIAGDTFTVGGQDAVMNNQTIYTSNGAGTGATIQLVYGISGGLPEAEGTPFTGWEPILLEQAQGTYTGSIQYTIALV